MYEYIQRMQLEIRENVPLAPLTTLGVGGPARFFAQARTEVEVQEAANFARAQGLALFVLGGGSNLVVSDRGWNGIVLQIAIHRIEQHSSEERIVFEAGTGLDWDEFVAHSVSQNCAGVECLSGIPGSVGGTPVQNVGAYGQEVSEVITSVQAFDLAENRMRELTAAQCRFAYRASIFNTHERGRYIILAVKFALMPNERPTLRYADLQKYFAGGNNIPTLAGVREAVRAIRASKGMLISPADPDSKSAGSFFKNPVLSAMQHEDLQQRASLRGLQLPSYPALMERRKISAAWLVENSGFTKGYTKGHAAISSKHALAIVNRGGATAAEIVALQDEIQFKVAQNWGVRLESEPVFLGF